MKKHTFENKTAKPNVKKLQFILLTSSPLICEVMTDACHIIINNCLSIISLVNLITILV